MRLWLLAVAVVAGCGMMAAAEPLTAIEKRSRLVEVVTKRIAPFGLPQDEYVHRAIGAIGKVPRDRLVPPDQIGAAYEDRPLEIGYGQTITDPTIVALMTALLRVRPNDRILEIGTGSGYQAAVLAQLVAEVDTIEIVAPLAERARKQLAGLGYRNIHVRQGDGYAGWAERAPFDGIIVTAGARCLPPALVAQLKQGGRMVIPLGLHFADEEITVVTKDASDGLSAKTYGPIAFVDFTGAIERSSQVTRFASGAARLSQRMRLCDAAAPAR